jgi:hypothetical protein
MVYDLNVHLLTWEDSLGTLPGRMALRDHVLFMRRIVSRGLAALADFQRFAGFAWTGGLSSFSTSE